MVRGKLKVTLRNNTVREMDFCDEFGLLPVIDGLRKDLEKWTDSSHESLYWKKVELIVERD